MVTIVQQQTRCGSMKADPADGGSEASSKGASVSSDDARKTTSKSRLGDRKGHRGKEYVLTSSNPVSPTFLRNEPFGKYVEGLSYFRDETCAVELAVQTHDFQDSTLCIVIGDKRKHRRHRFDRPAGATGRAAGHYRFRVPGLGPADRRKRSSTLASKFLEVFFAP
jgi:hypothetical protein